MANHTFRKGKRHDKVLDFFLDNVIDGKTQVNRVSGMQLQPPQLPIPEYTLNLQVPVSLTGSVCFIKTVNQTMALDIPQYLHKPQITKQRLFHQNYFIPIQTNSDAYKFLYFPRTVRFWNLLPLIVVTASSIDQFKNNLWKQINNGSITLVHP